MVSDYDYQVLLYCCLWRREVWGGDEAVCLGSGERKRSSISGVLVACVFYFNREISIVCQSVATQVLLTVGVGFSGRFPEAFMVSTSLRNTCDPSFSSVP